MKLSEKQCEFMRCLGLLLVYAYSKGYAFSDGGGEDRNKNDGHMQDSCHHYALAKDLNLFIDKKYIRESTHEAWADLHTYWEALSPMASPMILNDANHFSFWHNGKR
jgi:hypothetical protein